MRKFFMAVAATAAFGTLSLAAPVAAAEAQTAPINELVAAVQNGNVKADYVQDTYFDARRSGAARRYYRSGPRYVERRYNGPRRYYGNRYYGGRYYGDRGYYRRDYGSAAAAGAIGLATGAIIGGAIAQSQAAPVYGGNAYCAQRFRSYDPASGTYVGYDGRRHPCP